MNISKGLLQVRQRIAGFSLAMLIASFFAVSAVQAATFTDVQPSDWFYTYVEQLAADGVLNTSFSNYRPGDNANRAEAAKLLVEGFKLPLENPDTATFKDAAKGAWYYTYIETAYKHGIMGGYKDNTGTLTGSVGPGDPVTREQFAKMVVAAAPLTTNTKGGPHFSDVPSNTWSYDYVETAYNWSVVDGYADGTFKPGKNINRAEIAKMVSNSMNPVMRAGAGFSVESATATSATVTTVCFSGDVGNGADVAANYTVKDANGVVLAVSAAALATDPMCADLTTAAQTAGASYTITVAGVESATSESLATTDATFTGFQVGQTGGALSVDKAAETPTVGTLATKTANNTLLVLNFMAGAGENAQISGLTLTKMGIYNDSSVKVVAYDAANNRISSGVTFSDSKATLGFTTPLSVTAGNGGTKVYLKVSISGTSSGTLGIKLASASDVTSNSTNLSGTFPIEGPTMNVVDGTSSVASATVDSVTISAATRQVDIGETNLELAKFKVSETSSKEDLKLMSVTFFNNGSVADGDLKNFTLVDQNGVELAKVTDQVGKLVKFDLSATPYVLAKGVSRTFTVKVDVVNGSTRTGQLIVQNDFDINLVGVSTGASILAIADVGGTDTSFPIGDLTTAYNSITVNEGTLTVSKANTSPSGDVTMGATDAILGTFEVKALGESIEIQRVQMDLSSNGDGSVTNQGTALTGAMECISTSACDLTGSVKLMVDENLDGVPDKTLLSTTSSPSTLSDLWKQASLANYDLSSFYTVAGGKTVNLMIVGNITSNAANTATGETIKVGIKNVYQYKKSSLKYATSAPALVAANQLTVNSSTLTVSKNTNYGTQTIVSKSGAKIGSFILKTGSTEGVNITSVSLTGDDCAGGTALGYTNLWLQKDGTTQLGTTKGTVTFDNNLTSNTFSVSNFSIAKGAQVVIDVYADMASGVVGTDIDNVCLKVAATGVVGTGVTSQTTVNGPVAALTLQTINASANGNLTVSVSNDTPIAKQFTAGSLDNQVLVVKLTASNAEDLYVKKIRFMTDADADDVAISAATLKTGTAVGTLTQVGTKLNWQADSESAAATPGFVEWTFSGADRPKVTKNGTLYAGLYIDFTFAPEQAVSGKTPQFVLGNITAEGVSAISASGTGADLVNASGIIVQSNSSASYVTNASSAVLDVAISSATTQTITVALGTWQPGDIFFLDDNTAGAGDNTWDPATEELMVVIKDNGGTLDVIRGAFGTTAQAAYSVGTPPELYAVNSGTLAAGSQRLDGYAMRTFDTKPTFAVAASSPTGASTGALAKDMFYFNVTADNNTADVSENKVTLTSVNITTTKSGATVNNLVIYPSDHDLDANFLTTCTALSITKWGCVMATQSGSNQIIENTTKTFVVRGDVGTPSGNSSLEVSIASLGSQSRQGVITVNSGDAFWTDGTTPNGTAVSNWTYQPGATQIKPASALTYNGVGGVAQDVTAPTISSITITSPVADNKLISTDTIVILFSERMDPSTIGGLIPGAAAVAITDGATGDISVVADAEGASSYDLITIKNIIKVTTGATTFATGALTGAVNGALNDAGTTLTLTVTADLTGVGNDGTEGIEAATAAITMKDANGTIATATGSNGATVTSLDL